jgi:hypothetical protein
MQHQHHHPPWHDCANHALSCTAISAYLLPEHRTVILGTGNEPCVRFAPGSVMPFVSAEA